MLERQLHSLSSPTARLWQLTSSDWMPGPAEQRVLGQLEGAEDWSEVMDMASREVYYWNSITNEVVWEAPAGSKPRYLAFLHRHASRFTDLFEWSFSACRLFV